MLDFSYLTFTSRFGWLWDFFSIGKSFLFVLFNKLLTTNLAVFSAYFLKNRECGILGTFKAPSPLIELAPEPQICNVCYNTSTPFSLPVSSPSLILLRTFHLNVKSQWFIVESDRPFLSYIIIYYWKYKKIIN